MEYSRRHVSLRKIYARLPIPVPRYFTSFEIDILEYRLNLQRSGKCREINDGQYRSNRRRSLQGESSKQRMSLITRKIGRGGSDSTRGSVNLSIKKTKSVLRSSYFFPFSTWSFGQDYSRFLINAGTSKSEICCMQFCRITFWRERKKKKKENAKIERLEVGNTGLTREHLARKSLERAILLIFVITFATCTFIRPFSPSGEIFVSWDARNYFLSRDG